MFINHLHFHDIMMIGNNYLRNGLNCSVFHFMMHYLYQALQFLFYNILLWDTDEQEVTAGVIKKRNKLYFAYRVVDVYIADVYSNTVYFSYIPTLLKGAMCKAELFVCL